MCVKSSTSVNASERKLNARSGRNSPAACWNIDVHGIKRERMAKRNATALEIKEREARAQKLKDFMKNNLFSEVKFAETTGISRRTVQMVKAGKITPHSDTLRKFNTIFSRYESAAR